MMPCDGTQWMDEESSLKVLMDDGNIKSIKKNVAGERGEESIVLFPTFQP